MASLTRKKDGNYIIRSYAGSFTTLQVNADGVAFLKEYGIEENEEVPRPLIRQLLSKGLAFSTNAVVPLEPRQVASSLPSLIENGLNMVIQENEDGWSPSILFPELPSAWVRELYASPNAAVLQTCGFRVNTVNREILPAMRLWPSKGGAAYSVTPQTQSYTIEPVGPWPLNWDLHDWTQDIRGLEPMGTLFKGEGEDEGRLRAGKPIVPGVLYYFVLNTSISQALAQKAVLPIPSQLQPRSLGRCGQWEAWIIHTPINADSISREWCNRIGHPMEQPLWRLQLVSPPPLGYSANGVPIIEVEVEAIIAAFPPPMAFEVANSTALAIECDNSQVSTLFLQSKSNSFEKPRPFEDYIGRNVPIYFALPLQSVGTYRLRALIGRVTPLTFITAPADLDGEQIAITEQPPPLKAYISSDSSKVCIRAFEASHPRIDLPYISEESIPTIEVDCLSPVDVYWSCGESSGKQLALFPSDVTAYLSKYLVLTATTKHMFVLHIDAGNLGSLRLHFFPLIGLGSDTSIESPSLVTIDDSMISQRVRWLSGAVQALTRQDAPIVSIPGNIQKSLGQLKDWPNGAPLARLTRVPLTLLPHLVRLARSLDIYKHRNLSQIQIHSREIPHE